MDDNLKAIYNEALHKRHKNLNNEGEMKMPSVQIKAYNPLCGDDLMLYFKLDEGRIQVAKFSGFGCMLSTVSTDILLDQLIGKQVKEVKKELQMFIEGEKNKPIDFSVLNDMMMFNPVHDLPSRLDCVLLSWKAFVEYRW